MLTIIGGIVVFLVYDLFVRDWLIKKIKSLFPKYNP
jgi:hypothetical protein